MANEGNVIAVYSSDGVFISGADRNVVAGNKIGTDVTGQVSLGGQYSFANGVTIYGASNNTIGGTVTGAGNLIANNPGAGVAVESVPFGGDSLANAILENRIFGNSGPAIDLGLDGVTPDIPHPLARTERLPELPPSSPRPTAISRPS